MTFLLTVVSYRQRDVLGERQIGEDMKRLKYEANATAAQLSQRAFVQTAKRFAIDRHSARVDAIEAGNDV